MKALELVNVVIVYPYEGASGTGSVGFIITLNGSLL